MRLRAHVRLLLHLLASFVGLLRVHGVIVLLLGAALRMFVAQVCGVRTVLLLDLVAGGSFSAAIDAYLRLLLSRRRGGALEQVLTFSG